MFLALLLWFGAADAQHEAQVSRELATLIERIDGIQQQLRSSLAERDSLTARLAEIETELGAVTRQLRATRQQQVQASERLDDLRAQARSLEAGLEVQRQNLARQLRAAYAMGRESRVRLWLDQDDPARLGRNLAYYRYLNAARLEQIATLVADLAELATVRSSIESEQARLTALAKRLEDEQAERESMVEARRRTLAELDARMASQREELGTMEAERGRLESLLEQLRDALADIPDELEQPEFSTRKGGLRWPVAGRLLQGPGVDKPGALHRDGALIAAAAGSEVRALAGGRVAYADWLRGFGLLAIIDHGDDYMSLYAFNESLFKDVGDWVEEGELLALVGQSGGQREPALYFELRHRGKPVDPREWLQR